MDGLLTGLFTAPAGVGPTLPEFLLRLLAAGLCGQAIGWFYARSHGALSYSQTFVQALALLAMVVAVIMGVVGDSLARAFGLAAALAIVRFRTPVKDARDTTFLFLSVAAGMAAGSGALGIAAASTVVIGLSASFLQWTAYGLRSIAEGMLRFRFAGDEAARAGVDAVLRKHCTTVVLTAARQSEADGPEELVYDVNLRHREHGARLVNDLTALGAVSGVALLPLARAGES